MLLTALREVAAGTVIWAVLLGCGFLVMIALARDGCYLLWKNQVTVAPASAPVAWQKVTATLLLVAAGPLLAVFAGPLSDYAERAARQLHSPGAYVAGVLGGAPAKSPPEAPR